MFFFLIFSLVSWLLPLYSLLSRRFNRKARQEKKRKGRKEFLYFKEVLILGSCLLSLLYFLFSIFSLSNFVLLTSNFRQSLLNIRYQIFFFFNSQGEAHQTIPYSLIFPFFRSQ